MRLFYYRYHLFFLLLGLVLLFNLTTLKVQACSEHITQSLTLMGTVKEVDATGQYFTIESRSQHQVKVFVRENTVFEVIRNLDNLDSKPLSPQLNEQEKVKQYIKNGSLIVIQGINQEYECKKRFEARNIYLTHFDASRYIFEEDSQWWLKQIISLSNEWLDDLFGDTRTYQPDDFARSYRTNLNILGRETDDNIQECATLSRLIYGLSSAYLMTGNERYYLAARAGVEYQRQTFRILSNDGRHSFWAYGFKKFKNSSRLIIPSQNPDDLDTIPLYEQIYALAGLTQFYRISLDPLILEDIRLTINTFNDYYRDYLYGGYYSHIDQHSLSYDEPSLGENRSRKNWNSIGDHIPAYLINLLLALEPLPAGRRDLQEFRDNCLEILEMTATLIAEKFPDPDPKIPYVNERFFADWQVDQNWGWQKNRGIIGHNLKIAWNLIRCVNFFLYLEDKYHHNGNQKMAQKYQQLAQKLQGVAEKLGKNMSELGLDKLHGGVFDIVEREPKNGMLLEFPWGNTKEFWQQEQGILAYLILHGNKTNDREFLARAREISTFWNLFFLDRDNAGIFFRVNDNGIPALHGNYTQKGGHSISGYHAFELNYLAHIYFRTYVKQDKLRANKFTLYFKPAPLSGQFSINVLPDFFRPGELEISSITINGIKKTVFDKNNFQIKLAEEELGSNLVVEFTSTHPNVK